MKKYLKLSLFTFFIFMLGILNVSAEENVELISVELNEKSEYVEINEEVSLDGNKIISNVNFYDEGDYIIYKFKIKNNDERDYKISEIFDDNESEYLDFQYTYDELIGAKEEKEVLLKITYKSQLPYDAVLTPNNEFNAVNEISISVELEEVVINPSTFDNAKIYLIIEVIGVTSLLVIFVKLKKKNAVLLLILTLLLIPRNTNAKIDFKINFTFKNTMNLKVNYLSRSWRSFSPLPYTKIEFIKTKEFPEESNDVSEKNDGSIKAWNDNGTLYIGSRYKIFLPVNSDGLFQQLTNVESINFNNRVDTTFVTDMSNMFNKDIFEEIDLSSFRTGNVTSFKQMFENCSNLKNLDLSNWDVSSIINLSNMLYSCTSLESLIIDNWNLSNALYTSSLIYSCSKLKTVSAKNMIFPISAYYIFLGNNNSTLESIDLTGTDTSNTTSFYALFQNQKHLKEIKGIEDWDTSSVTDISYMFYEVGYDEEEADYSLDLTGWDVSNVNTASSFFEKFGYNAHNIDINISGWDLSKLGMYSSYFFNEVGYNANNVSINMKDVDLSNVTSSYGDFYRLGYNAKKVYLDLTNVDFSTITSLDNAFQEIGENCDEIIIEAPNVKLGSLEDATEAFKYVGMNSKKYKVNLKNWDVSSLKTMESMFANNSSGEEFELDLTGWDTSHVTNMYRLFYYLGVKANDLKLIGIDGWDVSSVETMESMFYSLGYDAKKINLDLSNWNVSNVNNFDYMFSQAATSPEEISIGDLSNWTIKDGASLKLMFNGIGYYSNAILDIGTLNLENNNIRYLFSGNYIIKAIINLKNNPSDYEKIFNYAAVNPGSGIVVNYTSNVTNIDDIIATKSADSNVVKGELIEE